ncbi:MAG: FkbM family methyltransferase [Kiloniellales bacterium]
MPTMDEVMVVADIGARYGMHPSWNGFDGKLRYIAFEPDEEEAERLRASVACAPTLHYEVLATALDRYEGERDFHLLKHRGLSSCLKPDLTSECFRHLKPGQAEIEKIVKVKVRRLDDVMDELGTVPDFLKVDTEGTEQDVVEGAERLFARGMLGVRASCNFQPCFIGQRLFSEQHDYLLARDFFLLNIDYKGYGFPRLGLFRKPDPMENEDFRYGILVHADGVWIRKLNSIDALFTGDERAFARLKLSYFCMLNNAPDVGVDIARETRADGLFSPAVKASRLYRALQLRLARFLGRWRTVPDEQWEKAAGLYREIFDEELKGGSEFYPQVDALVSTLREVA